jgi:hypothetical protein
MGGNMAAYNAAKDKGMSVTLYAGAWEADPNANQGGTNNGSENNPMEPVISAGDMIDKGWTYARLPSLVNTAYSAASKAANATGAMKPDVRSIHLMSPVHYLYLRCRGQSDQKNAI